VNVARLISHPIADDAGRFVRPALLVCALLASAPISTPSIAAKSADASAAVAVRAGTSVADFYALRKQRPLWIMSDGSSPAGQRLVALIEDAEADGLKSRTYRVSALERALRSARGGDPRARMLADRLLSETFTAFARDVRKATSVPMIWVDADVRPSPVVPATLLRQAAAAPSLERFVSDMGWMHPLYAGLRRAIASGQARSKAERALLRVNLDRARMLPATGKFALVNSADARLTMFEGTRAVDTMRVVVGKPAHPTPMMAANIRFTSLNPYWNVPSDLAAERIAPNVVNLGLPYLKEKGYQVLSGWNDKAKVVNPATIDWAAVAAGRREIRLRQLPGPANSMGNMKFMFPNAQGIYLHDTPQKELLGEESRMFSGGCVRLEDAPRFAKWLYGKRLRAPSAKPETKVNLPRPVPVFLTYITAVPTVSGITYLPDVYGRDAQALKGVRKKSFFASR
jgi:murein L,D-transpeptidase YcbB/YkuD